MKGWRQGCLAIYPGDDGDGNDDGGGGGGDGGDGDDGGDGGGVDDDDDGDDGDPGSRLNFETLPWFLKYFDDDGARLREAFK